MLARRRVGGRVGGEIVPITFFYNCDEEFMHSTTAFKPVFSREKMLENIWL